MLIPIRVDRTSKPPIGTPLRSDGHWSVQGLVGAWAFNEGAGQSTINVVTGSRVVIQQGSGVITWTPDGMRIDDLAVSLNTPPPLGAMTIVSKGDYSNTPDIALSFKAGSNYPGIRYQGVDYTVLWLAASGNYRVFNAPLGYATRLNIIVIPGNSQSDVNSSSWYVDGKALSVSSTDSTSPQDSRDSLLKGIIGLQWINQRNDYLGIYNRVLTPDQVKSLSDNPWQIYEPETIWANLATGATLDQYSFRFINDDSSEDAGTFLAAENANVTQPPGSVMRLRMLLNATGDPDEKRFQLEYRRKPSGGEFGAWAIVQAATSALRMIPIRVDRTSKPPIGTPLRTDGHWSVQGLAGVWAFNEGAGFSVFDGVTGTVGSVTNSAGGKIDTLGVDFPQGTSGTPNYNDAILLKRKIPSPTLTITAVVFLHSSMSGLGWDIITHGEGGPALRIVELNLVKVSADQGVSAPTSGLALVPGKTQTVCASVGGGSIVYGLNGDTETYTYSPSFTFNNNIFCNGIYLEDTRYYGRTSKYYLVLWHTVALLPQQIASLSENPWQIYEPETLWIQV